MGLSKSLNRYLSIAIGKLCNEYQMWGYLKAKTEACSTELALAKFSVAGIGSFG